MEIKASAQTDLVFSLGPKTLANREIIHNDRPIGLLRGPFRTARGVSFRTDLKTDGDIKVKSVVADAFWKWYAKCLYGSIPFVGVVRWFDEGRGVGFIVDRQGRDILVHHEIVEIKDHGRLRDGDRVEYEVADGFKGLIAVKVQRIESPAPADTSATSSLEADPASLPFTLAPKALCQGEIIFAGRRIGKYYGPARNTAGVLFRADLDVELKGKAERLMDAFWRWFIKRTDNM